MVYVVRFLAITIFAYLVWRKLRDNLDEDINGFLWSCLLAFFIGGRLGWGFANLLNWKSSFWDWLFFWDKIGFNILVAFICLYFFVFIYSLFNRWNFVELAEDLLFPIIFLAWWWIFPDWYLTKNNLIALFMLNFLLVVVSGIWARRYRSFYWYKSGKKGFLFLFSALMFCLFTIVISYMVEVWVFYRYLALVFGLIFSFSLVMLGELIDFDRGAQK